ncbi:MAG: hypothetical protein WCK75_05525 [Elusimicrobiota bacterium]
MITINKVAAAGLLMFNFISYASAVESDALKSSGLDISAVAVLDVPAPSVAETGQAASPNLNPFSYFGYGETPSAISMSVEDGTAGLSKETVASVVLESVKNAYLKPEVTFTTGKGTKVHISGTKASNCPDGGNSCDDKEKFFLVLTTDKNETFFVRGMEIINYSIIYNGSKTVTIDGEKYVVKIFANPSVPESSTLEVKGPRGVALNATIKKIGDGVALKGVDVKLSKTYKLAYGNEIVQGPQGARFTTKMLILLVSFPVATDSTYFILNAADITPAGVTFPGFEKNFGFRLNAGTLEIYRI